MDAMGNYDDKKQENTIVAIVPHLKSHRFRHHIALLYPWMNLEYGLATEPKPHTFGSGFSDQAHLLHPQTDVEPGKKTPFFHTKNKLSLSNFPCVGTT